MLPQSTFALWVCLDEVTLKTQRWERREGG
jgi:hypothetical protein